jgi:hypothetical protein
MTCVLSTKQSAENRVLRACITNTMPIRYARDGATYSEKSNIVHRLNMSSNVLSRISVHG